MLKITRGIYIVEKQVKISIITVSYNAVKTIEQTIYTVVSQTYNNIEYIIIDGGSMDGTVDVIKKYEDKIAYWVSEPDGGIYDAMNKGIGVATGSYVYFLGADDALVDENVIKNITEEISRVKGDIYSYGVYMVRSSDNKQCYVGNEYAKKHIYPVRMIPHQGMFVKLSLAKKYNFDTKYRIAADHKFFLQCKLQQNLNVIYKDQPVAFFSLDGMSSNHLLKNQDEVKKIFVDLGLEYPANNSNFIKNMVKRILCSLGIYSFAINVYDGSIWHKHTCSSSVCRWCGRK